jgi:hypothetical protein
MTLKILPNFFSFEKYLQFLVLSIPVLLITGPFLPDLFLTLSSLSFLIFLISKKKINFLNHKIFYLFIIFFFILTLSSIISDYRAESLITSLAYLRFGVFIFVINFLINREENFIKNLLKILLGIFVVLFFDSILQKFVGFNIFGVKNPYGRITSLFGEDIKLGSYIVRLLPLLTAILIYFRSKNYLIIGILVIATFLTLLSGERISFLMIIFFLTGFIIFNNMTYKLKLLILITPLIFTLIALLNQEIRYRILTATSNQINLTNKKPFFEMQKHENGVVVISHIDSTILPRAYQMYFETAIKIFRDNILIGTGPRTYPLKSKEDRYYTVSNHEGWINYVKIHNKQLLEKLFKIHNEQLAKIPLRSILFAKETLTSKQEYYTWLKGWGIDHRNFDERIKNKEWLKGFGYLDKEYKGFTNISGVNNHPHNTYLQLLSETGLLGFLFLLTLWIYFIVRLFSKIDLFYKCIILGFVINFFPFIFSGNFFNNWLSILYFYPLGFLFKENIKT